MLGLGPSLVGCTVITGAGSRTSVGGSGNWSFDGTSGTSLIDFSGREWSLFAGVARIVDGGNAPSLAWCTGFVGTVSNLQKATPVRKICWEQKRKN